MGRGWGWEEGRKVDGDGIGMDLNEIGMGMEIVNGGAFRTQQFSKPVALV